MDQFVNLIKSKLDEEITEITQILFYLDTEFDKSISFDFFTIIPKLESFILKNSTKSYLIIFSVTSC